MVIQRLPSAAISSTLLSDLAQTQRTLSTVQERIATGRQILRPSDDPLGTAAALDQRGSLRRVQQYRKSLDDAASWLRLGDDALTSAGDSMSEVRRLVVEAASTRGPAAMEAIAADLEGVRSQILQLANTSLAGRPIFAGTKSTTSAFAADGTYLGDTGAVTRTVADGTNIDVNVAGSTAFSSVLAALHGVVVAIRAGDSAGIQTGLAQIDASTQDLSSSQATIGARTRQVESLSSQTDLHLDQIRSNLSEIEDVDMAWATVDLKRQEASYQAALSVTARAVQPSLVDFLH